MRRGLELRLQKLERSGNQWPARAICIVGTDEADCERQLQEMRAARPLGRCPIINMYGRPPDVCRLEAGQCVFGTREVDRVRERTVGREARHVRVTPTFSRF